MSLVFLVDMATRQMVAEVEVFQYDSETELNIDGQGFVVAKDPVLIAEIRDQSGRTSVVMRPIFENITVDTLKIKVSAWMSVTEEDHKLVRNGYEQVQAQIRAARAGLVTATSIPNNAGNKIVLQ